MTNMNIALCTDDNYANYCAVCITSILENNKDADCHIYVMTSGLTAENTAKFSFLNDYYHQKLEVKVTDVSVFSHLQSTNHLSQSMYYRFLLPDIVEGDEVLYLDCDIIVRHSLKELFETNLTDLACCVVEDQNGDDLRLHNPINMFSRYFNSGMLLMNLKYWREHNIAKKLIDYIANFNGQLMCPDQDALNAVLEGKVAFLDYKYNFQQGFYGNLDWLQANKWPAVRESQKDPIILHYTGREKPWHKDCKHPLVGEFDYYSSLHTILSFKKNNCHSSFFYLVERVATFLKKIYHSFRDRNGLYTNKIA